MTRRSRQRMKGNGRRGSEIATRVKRFVNSAVRRGNHLLWSQRHIIQKIEGRWQTIRDSLKIPTAAEIDVLKRRVIELEKKLPREPRQAVQE